MTDIATLQGRWFEATHEALDRTYGPGLSDRIAARLWGVVSSIYLAQDTLAGLLQDKEQEDPAEPGSGHMLPILDVFARLNPHARDDVHGLRDALVRVEAERDARGAPSQVDDGEDHAPAGWGSSHDEDIALGLTLALHILTNGAACDPAECLGHESWMLTGKDSPS